MFAGFALIPSPDVTEAVIRFRDSTPAITGPLLGTEANLPHLTLFQGIYPDGFDPAPALDWLSTAAAGVSSTFTGLTREPGDWAFAQAAPTRQLITLHHLAAGASAAHMSAPAAAGMADWDRSEIEAFERFGYRYALNAFMPHITLGTAVERIDGPTQYRFAGALFGTAVKFDRVVYYRAGERGALAQVLEGRELRRPVLA
jgi:2'-5' RNA ligase